MARKKKSLLSGLGGAFGRTKKRGKKSPFDKLATSGRRKGKKSKFGAGILAGLKPKASKRSRRDSQIVRQAARAWTNRMTPTERYDERQEVLDAIEQNPKRFAEEVRANRLARVFPWLNRVAAFLAGYVKKEK